jgi:hypothetical protein
MRQRKKEPSKPYRDEFGHTLLSAEEFPWRGGRLIIGAGGYGSLPIMPGLRGGSSSGTSQPSAARRRA